MNSLVAVAFCITIAAVNAGALIGPAEPGAVLQGPSSSAIVQGPDGSVISATQPGGTVVAAPKAGGIVADHSPLVLGHAGVIPSVLAARSAYLAHPGLGYPYFAPGSGLEGQWVPDNLEQLYDDGQYRGEIYA